MPLAVTLLIKQRCVPLDQSCARRNLTTGGFGDPGQQCRGTSLSNGAVHVRLCQSGRAPEPR